MKGGTTSSNGWSIETGVDHGPNGLGATDMKLRSIGLSEMVELTVTAPCLHVAA